jgi:hypothetical protein
MGHGLVIISLKQISPPAEMFDFDMDPAERAEEEMHTEEMHNEEMPNTTKSKAPKGPFAHIFSPRRLVQHSYMTLHDTYFFLHF